VNVVDLAAARRIESRKQAVARAPVPVKLLLVALATLIAFLVPRVAGAGPTPLNNLGYAPILLGAYLFGWRGGLLVGLLTTVTIGPLPGWLGLPTVETVESTLTRGAFFVAVGGLTGFLFDRSRAALDGWRSAAITIAAREREAMVALAHGAEAKDTVTADHISRVQMLTEDLALALAIEPSKASDLGWSAMLHDVGKLHVPDRILRKHGPLSAREWEIMRRHTVWGAEILAQGDGFELARRVARWHHENFDGSGYPDGLRRDAIPLEARIVRITDSFDAMTNQRAYMRARSIEEALEELDRFAGTQFDPELVRVFIDRMRATARGAA
jgi:HD-GYP domain-containing protein (c-di-GMP phosphodiesterase class II)